MAWERTPGELLEYIEAYRDRLEQQAYMLYNQAACIASMVLSSHRVAPEDAFPGVIRRKVMTSDAIYAACLAWTSGADGQEDGA